MGGSRSARVRASLPRGRGLSKPPNPPHPPARTARRRDDRFGVLQAKARGEHGGRAGLHDIRVRVGRVERASGPDETGDDGTLEVVLRDRRHAAQKQWVVHEQHAGTQRHGLLRRVRDGVDGEVHTGDR